MKKKITGIALGSIRHSDRYNVTNVYTLEKGRMALLTPAGSGKGGRQTASRLQPLSVFEAQVTISSTHELCIPSGITPCRVWRNLYFQPEKATVAFFIAEFLSRLLRDAPSEPNVWRYITESIEYFDTIDDKTATANFHIAFLIGMTHFMGIHPDLSGFTPGMEFDMQAGEMTLPFLSMKPGRVRLDAKKSAFMPKLDRINYANSRHFRFSGKERSELLDLILQYYGCHFPGSDNLKSPEVLKEVFQ